MDHDFDPLEDWDDDAFESCASGAAPWSGQSARGRDDDDDELLFDDDDAQDDAAHSFASIPALLSQPGLPPAHTTAPLGQLPTLSPPDRSKRPGSPRDSSLDLHSSPKKQRRASSSLAPAPLERAAPAAQLPTPPPADEDEDEVAVTDAEMDLFFGFVAPVQPPRAPSPPPRRTAAEKGKGRADLPSEQMPDNQRRTGSERNDFLGREGEKAQFDSPPMLPNPRATTGTDQADPLYQLMPVPAFSPSGHPLTSTEKRCADSQRRVEATR